MTTQTVRQQVSDLEAIRKEVECTRQCECVEPESDRMPEVRPFGGGVFTECLEKRPCACNMKLYFGGTAFCKCPFWQRVSNLDQP